MSQITTHIQGKTIEAALTDGKDLILRCTDGQEFVIGFESGPYLKGTNVRIVLPVPGEMSGKVFGS
jgi:hypothetical protein